MGKNISDIHFSVHSILTDQKLMDNFFWWVAGVNPQSDYHFIDYLNSPITKSLFSESITWTDIINYCQGIKYVNNKVTEIELEELRIKRIEIAEELFDLFLHKGLNDKGIKLIEDKWNSTFNSFPSVDYDAFDFSIEGYSGILNGKPFILHEQQKKGVAFLCSKGNGLLAYDVGVGKTATGIVSVVHQLQSGKCKRPLIVVPKAVYSKWVHDTKELFPSIKVNELENLNGKILNEIKMASIFEEGNDGFLLAKNSISICTAEALEKITFNEETMKKILIPGFNAILSEKKVWELFEPSDDILSSVFFEKLGIDLLLVDEAHRYKNLIRKTGKGAYTEFSNFGFGEPSVRALRMFGLTEYIHRHNDEKNVFFLSATPFTNSPMEIYSMLRFLGGNEIVELGYKTINDFLNEFAEIKIEWSVNNKGEVVRKTVMKNFRSLYAMQKLIQNYIDKVSAEDAQIKRPEKDTHVEKIQMTNLQKRIYAKEVHRISTAHSLGDVFKGINNMRMCMISPALVNENYEDLQVPDLKELVSSSPKLLLVCQIIIKVYDAKPDCGQIIYLPRGIKESKIIKEYLVKKGIPEKAIALINSGTTENQKQKITDSFNDPENIVKILIGSETISEGVDLNGNSLVLYNCLLGWNPTEPIQVEGRLWRQGNRQKKVHIVYPLMYDSIDSLIYQKHDEKGTRIDAIWNYRGDKINVEEINPEELKFDLIKDPKKKAAMMMEKETIPIRRELQILEDSRDLIQNTEKRIALVNSEIAMCEKRIWQIKQEKKDSQPTEHQEVFLKLTAIINSEYDNKISEYENQLEEKKQQLKQLEIKLKKKLNAVLGANYSQEDLNQYFNKLEEKQIQVESKLPELKKKQQELEKQLAIEFKQKKNEIRSVDEIAKDLVKKIVSNEA